MEQNSSLFGIGIDNISKSHLSEAARWARFLAICGFVMIGMMLIYGLLVSIVSSDLSKLDNDDVVNKNNKMQSVLGIVMFIVLAVCALLAFFPCLLLLRFANKIKRALESDDQSELNSSFMNLKILYRYLGIFAVIGLAFMVLSMSLVLTEGAL